MLRFWSWHPSRNGWFHYLSRSPNNGLVHYRPDRQASRYSLDEEAVSQLAKDLGGLLESCCSVPKAARCDELVGAGGR